MTMKTTEWKQFVEGECCGHSTEAHRVPHGCKFCPCPHYARAVPTYRMRVKYGVDQDFATQAAHFSITAEIEEKRNGGWREHSGGCLHEAIAKHFPELAPLIRWHLFAPAEGPLHYIANGLYWWRHAMQLVAQEDQALAHFKSTIVFGAIEGHPALASDSVMLKQLFQPRASPATQDSDVKTWLDARLPILLEICQRELTEAGVWAMKKRKTVKMVPHGKDICIYCNRRVGPRGLDIDGDAAHKKCHRENGGMA